MSRIISVLASAGLGGYFFDDQAAIKAGAVRDGAAYIGTPVTRSYRDVREPAESVSVQLILDDGYIAVGDCASVQYSGIGGREPRFRSTELAKAIENELAPQLVGLDVSHFRSAARRGEQLINETPGLGRAAAYGVSQALLHAAAHSAGHHLPAQIIIDEWELPGPIAPVPLYGQTGEDRYTNVDKLILKQVPVIPHGLINTPNLLGPDGDALVEYISWIRDRIGHISPTVDYLPVLHLDVYGQVGAQVGRSIVRAADILQRLEEAAGPHVLRIEHPIHARSRGEQIEIFLALRRELLDRGSQVQLIADEWANTLEDIRLFAQAGATHLIQIKTPDLGSIHNTVDAILACKSHGTGAVLGGTCAETDHSARTTTHVGIATGVTQMLAKPGMGVDEGLVVVINEMNRAVRLSRFRAHAHQSRGRKDLSYLATDQLREPNDFR